MRKNYIIMIALLISLICTGCVQKTNNFYEGYWIGFIGGKDKIHLVGYNPDKNNFQTIDSFPNNALVEDAAMNITGEKYAYTLWNKQGTQETLVVKDNKEREKEFFNKETIPCELKGLSFIDGDKILLRKVEIPSGYPIEKIVILDTTNGKITKVEEGYVGKIANSNSVQHNSRIELLTEEKDINNILQQYGSDKDAEKIEEDTVLFAKLSNPTVVKDKSKIFYTKTLFRNIAIKGEGVMLGSSVWCYDTQSKENNLLYKTNDNAIIGYVAVNPSGDSLVVSIFEKPTGEDGFLLKIDISNPEQVEAIEETKKIGYVFLEPLYLDDNRLTYLSVENGKPIEEGKRYLFHEDTRKLEELEAIYNDKKQILRNFSKTL
ncbi:hypothetical protein [Aminipila sp.]|uniref:hypothetical protein n=1 Tax=Aminipila sp. TaxID=2060095 RepID=UPI0028A1562B|nr:hypothetical protein [Aminipila sp.]